MEVTFDVSQVDTCPYSICAAAASLTTAVTADLIFSVVMVVAAAASRIMNHESQILWEGERGGGSGAILSRG
jgi:hypothetical protein